MIEDRGKSHVMGKLCNKHLKNTPLRKKGKVEIITMRQESINRLRFKVFLNNKKKIHQLQLLPKRITEKMFFSCL